MKNEINVFDEMEVVPDTTKDGKEIIPFVTLNENEPFKGRFLGMYYYPDKETFESEQERKLNQDDRESFSGYKFERENGERCLVNTSYKLDEKILNNEGHGFEITYKGKTKISGTAKTVKNYLVKKSKSKNMQGISLSGSKELPTGKKNNKKSSDSVDDLPF